ncbi:MAG: SGNH/GDSL hydrolase family protein [Clostridia bacterium]|nr:SGNH/GDSL hydrolase family protein [Clostridia bacterium]
MKKSVFRFLALHLCILLILPFALCNVSALDTMGQMKSDEEGTVLVNLFPRSGGRNKNLRKNANEDVYLTSSKIEVAEGDVLYLGAMRKEDSDEALLLYTASKSLQATKKMNSLELVEDIGRGYGIYRFTVPSGVGFVEVRVHIGVYNDGDVLVTKNQPFTGVQMRAFLGIEEIPEEVKAHPYYGKKALFLGDSLTYGSYDTPQSYRNPSASWARAFAKEIGMEVTNAGVGGASIAKLSTRPWIYNQYLDQKDKAFDVIFLEGGGNDSGSGVEIGTPLPVDSSPAALEAATASFAGGLQWLLHSVKENWPDAELFYHSSFKFANKPKEGTQDLRLYFEQAKVLCQMYGVTYIDLYDDEKLYDSFYPAHPGYVPDKIHPTEMGYSLINPRLIELFNALAKANAPSVQEPEAPSTDQPSPDVTEPAPVTSTQASEQKTGGCQSAQGTLATAGFAAAAGAALVKRKRRKQ